MFLSVPFAFLAILYARDNQLLTWIFISIAITFLCLNWTLVADMLLYLVVPNRRSFAQSIQILFSHLLGDALSPYIVGLVRLIYNIIKICFIYLSISLMFNYI